MCGTAHLGSPRRPVAVHRIGWLPSVPLRLARRSQSEPVVEGDAVRKLAEYCGQPAYRSFDAAVSDLRARAAGSRTRGEIGKCGAHRYVAYSDGYWGFTELFDASGAMIGAVRASDISLRQIHGQRIDCDLIPTERLCPAEPR